MCTSPDSNDSCHSCLGLIPDVGPFKTCKEEWMATRSHQCWQSDIREPTVGEGWCDTCIVHSSWCWTSATSHMGLWPRAGVVLSRGFVALLFSKGTCFVRVLRCCSACYDKEIISVFLSFCLTFFKGMKCIADSFMKKAKNTLNNRSYM